jgi:nucleoside-diphosphate-sugar epimerase
MKVLISGASGFLGNAVVSIFEALGIDYCVIGRKNKPGYSNFWEVDLLTDFDYSELTSFYQPTHLIHLAWYVEHGEYWSSYENLKWTNASYRLLDSFYKNGGKHAVVAGTCAEYDWQYGYFKENLTPLNPHTLYGMSKDNTRRTLELLASQYGATLAWGRIFFPYGIDEPQSRLIPSLFQVFKLGKLPFGVNKSAFRDLLHVSDVAEAFIKCLETKYHGVINICSGKPLQIEQLVQQIAYICKQSPEPVLSIKDGLRKDPQFLIGDNTILKSLGWQQKICLNDGLSHFLSKYERNDSL